MTKTKFTRAALKAKAIAAKPKTGGKAKAKTLFFINGKKVTVPTSTVETPCPAKTLGEWRRKTGLARRVFAEISHVSERSLASYEKQAQVPPAARGQLTEAQRLVEALQEIIPGPQLKVWLQTPNPGFGGRTPRELNRSGERDLLWEMIYQTRHGAFA